VHYSWGRLSISGADVYTKPLSALGLWMLPGFIS
jgi:hypothetical protein